MTLSKEEREALSEHAESMGIICRDYVLRLLAALEAAEDLLVAQEEFDAIVGQPEFWDDPEKYRNAIVCVTTELQCARNKWREVNEE